MPREDVFNYPSLPYGTPVYTVKIPESVIPKATMQIAAYRYSETLIAIVIRIIADGKLLTYNESRSADKKSATIKTPKKFKMMLPEKDDFISHGLITDTNEGNYIFPMNIEGLGENQKMFIHIQKSYKNDSYDTSKLCDIVFNFMNGNDETISYGYFDADGVTYYTPFGKAIIDKRTPIEEWN